MTGWNDNIRGSSKRERAMTVSSITARDLRALFLNWIAADNLPFKTAESPHFRQFLQYVNPHANDLLPVSGKTTRQDLKASVNLRRPAIVKTLKQARSKIHLVYNGWTSTNHMSLFGIQARFLDTDLQLQTLLLGLPKINQDHSGVDCAQLAIATLERYEYSYQLGFTVSDNASNMDTMVQEIERQFEANGHRWDAQFHRLRCLGHIIHLAASDFFFRGGKVSCHPRRRRPPPVAREGRRNQPTAAAEPAADLAVEDDAPTPAPIVNDAAAWRKYGCYGMLHNIVVWVPASTARRERFKALSHLQLIRDNVTRWHSYYNMCNRALEVKDQLVLFLTNKQDLEDEALTLEDWRHLAEITSFFYPFFNATKTNKGIFDAIDRVLPGFEHLLSHLEHAYETYENNEYILDRVDAAWMKLDKYYRYTDKTNACVAATVLNPLYKWHFFEQRWMEPTLAAALADHRVQFQELWRLNYAGDPSPQLNIPQEPHDDVDDFEAFLYCQVMQRPVLDDLQLYL